MNKKFGDSDYGMYGYGFCNPAFYGQEPVTNQQYIDTIPDDDPWKPIIVAGAARLDEQFPGWKIGQIKEKFGGCRFYADPSSPERWTSEFQAVLSAIERECDAV